MVRGSVSNKAPASCPGRSSDRSRSRSRNPNKSGPLHGEFPVDPQSLQTDQDIERETLVEESLLSSNFNYRKHWIELGVRLQQQRCQFKKDNQEQAVQDLQLCRGDPDVGVFCEYKTTTRVDM